MAAKQAKRTKQQSPLFSVSTDTALLATIHGLGPLIYRASSTSAHSPTKSKSATLPDGLAGMTFVAPDDVDTAVADGLNALPAQLHTLAAIVKTRRELQQQLTQIHQQLQAIANAKIDGKIVAKNLAELNKIEQEIIQIKQKDEPLLEKINAVEQEWHQLCQQQEKEWDALREKALSELRQKLEESGVPLNSLEIEELQRQDNRAELQRRFEQHGLTLPKEMNYFEAKAQLAVIASSNRRMKPIDVEKLK